MMLSIMAFIMATESKSECLGARELNSAPKTPSTTPLPTEPFPWLWALCSTPTKSYTYLFSSTPTKLIYFLLGFFFKLVINNRFPVTITFVYANSATLQSLLATILLCLDQDKVPLKCPWDPRRPGMCLSIRLSLALSLGSMTSNQAHLSSGFGFIHNAHDLDLGLCSLSSLLPVTILSFSRSQGSCKFLKEIGSEQVL